MFKSRELYPIYLVISIIAIALVYAVYGPHDVYVAFGVNHFIAGLVNLQTIATAVSYGILTTTYFGTIFYVAYAERESFKRRSGEQNFQVVVLVVGPGLLLVIDMSYSAWLSGLFIGPLIGALVTFLAAAACWLCQRITAAAKAGKSQVLQMSN